MQLVLHSYQGKPPTAISLSPRPPLFCSSVCIPHSAFRKIHTNERTEKVGKALERRIVLVHIAPRGYLTNLHMEIPHACMHTTHYGYLNHLST